MASVYDTVFEWARKRGTSFAELCFVSSERSAVERVDNTLIYRLKRWPDLPTHIRTADVLRALSVMSNRPINRHWILAHSKLRAEDVDSLLARLIKQDAVEVIDRSTLPPRRTARH